MLPRVSSFCVIRSGHIRRTMSSQDDFAGHPYRRGQESRPHRGRGGYRGGERRGRGHPPGLRGREIGLFYARQNRGRGKSRAPMAAMSLDHQTVDDVLRQTSATAAQAQPDGTHHSHWEEDMGPTDEVVVAVPKSSSTFSSSAVAASSASSNVSSLPSSSYAAPATSVPAATVTAASATSASATGDELTFSRSYHEHDMDIRQRVPEIDDQVLTDFLERRQMPAYLRMQETRHQLPSYSARQALLDAIHRNQVCVVSGDTGCGKTTQLCQYILDEAILAGDASLCNVICTQPRRISAISVARRVAEERCQTVGGESSSVGYQIRLESAMPSKRGSIVYCTTGCVLRWLISDPMIKRCSHLVLDEVHERNIHTDFLMVIVKDLLPKRPDLKVVLMSATLNQQLFSKYFNSCPMTHIPGTAYPVTKYYLEDTVEMTGYVPPPEVVYKGRCKSRKGWEERQEYETFLSSLPHKYKQQTIESMWAINLQTEIDLDLIVCLLKHICTNMEPGAILCFLPGWGAITKLHDIITSDVFFQRERIIPLHSLLPTKDQVEVFQRPPPGVRKIVLATAIAETSITIDDVVFVIDAGWMKEKNYDESTYLESLDQVRVTKANAIQRAGRAGRVQPGHCFHLFYSKLFDTLKDYQLPEMLRTSLDDVILQIRLLDLGRAIEFLTKSMQPPNEDAIQSSLRSLQRMSALDVHENLTPLGYHLAQLPLEPHVGKLVILAAIFSVVDPVLTIAASLSYKDPFVVPLGKRDRADAARKSFSRQGEFSDHMVVLRAFEGWARAYDGYDFCRRNFLSHNTLKMIKDMKGQLATALRNGGFLSSGSPSDPAANKNSGNERLVSAILVAGLYPRVAQVDCRKRVKIQTEHHRRCSFHPASICYGQHSFPTQFAVYNKMLKADMISIFDGTFVTPFALLFFGGQIAFEVSSEESNVITIDNWIRINAEESTAQKVQDLRHQLDGVLWKLYQESHRSARFLAAAASSATFQFPMDTSGPGKSALLETIIALISQEQNAAPERACGSEAKRYARGRKRYGKFAHGDGGQSSDHAPTANRPGSADQAHGGRQFDYSSATARPRY